MISTVKGRFGDVSGTLVGDDTDLGQAAIELTIGAASVDTREAQRDAHLRSADFFETDRFPAIRFRSRRIERDGDGFRVTGGLTIRDVTREVRLAVELGGRVRDPWGGERVGYTATTRINRSDFGLKWNQLLEAGGVAVSDEVKISVDLELVKAA
jgi:polyisoprenoid-binding protein YceI